jgi:hypothetical protein
MRIALLTMCLLLLSSPGYPQEPDKEFQEFLNESQRELEETLSQNKTEYDTFLERINKDYLEYVSQAEKEFIDLLPSSFKDFPLETPLKQEGEPKPVQIEKFVPAGPSLISLHDNKNIPVREVEPALPSFLPAGHVARNTENLTLQFLGQNFQVTYDSALRLFNVSAGIDPNTLKVYMEALQKTNYQTVIEQLYSIKNNLNLNDWDYFCLTGEFCKSLTAKENSQHILAWFLLLESNYKVKIGYNKNAAFLFFASKQPIYQMPWLNIRGVRYYSSQCKTDSISTYDIDHFKGYKYVNLFHDKPLLLGEMPKVKTIHFPYRDSTYSVSLHYNQRYIDYYSQYPKIPVDYYFTQPVSETFRESVISEIAPLLYHKNQQEILQILLNLVQYGFNYATDQEQFNEEKYMVPEELLYYHASDCDDRTILFSCLVNELTETNIVALGFKGHICTAVEVTDSALQGNFVLLGKKYIICDPTYVGAAPGIIMPPFQTKDATIIDFNKGLNEFKKSEKVWNVAAKRGLMQADISQNMVISRDGAIYITGMMHEDSLSSEHTVKATSGKVNTFVARLNAKEEIEWIRQIQGSEENSGYCISLMNGENIYLFGYFRDTLKFDDFSIRSQENGSFYLARINVLGAAVWLRRIDIPKMDSLTMGITVVLDSVGDLKYYKPNNHYPSDRNYVMQVDNKGTCYLYAMLPMNVIDSSADKHYASGGNFDIISYLVNENNNLVKQNYPKSVSLLFTIIQYLRRDGSKINGIDLQKTIAAIDNDHITAKPALYNCLKDIHEIASSDGITLIRTIDRKPVALNPLLAEHESRLKISYISGNARIDVLNGVSIGHAPAWNKLNYILLEKSTGEIIYDYDNHYRNKMPVYSELLK